MKSKRTIRFQFRAAGAALALAAALVAAPAAEAQQVTLRYGHVTQTSHPYHIGAEMFREAVRQKTNGRVEIQIFPARQLGDDRQLLEGVRMGTIDSALVSSSTFALFTPVMDALQLPWLIASYERLADAFLSQPAQRMLDSLDGLGLKGLGFYEGGFRHFMSRTKPVRTLADMQGMKMRVVPNPLHIAIFRAVGASPTPMPYGEIYIALQTGVIDGAEMNISSILAERFYETSRHVSLTGQFFFPAVTIVNKARFERLAPDLRQALIEAARETTRAQVMATRQQEVEASDLLRAQGVKIVPFDEMDAARARVKSVSDEYEGRHPLIREFAALMKATTR